MKISQEQLISLWKTSLSPLTFRKPSWILESFWTPALLLLLPAAMDNFDRMTIIKYGAFFGLILIASLIIYITLQLIISRKILRKYPYQSMLILYIAFDSIILLAIGLSLMSMGLMTLSQYGNLATEKLEAIRSVVYIYILFVSVLAFTISPRFVLMKSQLILKEQRISNKKEVALRFLMGAAPGVGMIFFSFFSRESVLLINFVAGFSICLTTISLLISIPNFWLISVFLIHKWPKIVKSGPKFVVID